MRTAQEHSVEDDHEAARDHAAIGKDDDDPDQTASPIIWLLVLLTGTVALLFFNENSSILLLTLEELIKSIHIAQKR